MSVLIKYMEMPKDGVYWCEIGVAGEIAMITIHGEDRKSFHLIPIPPHGRLIDADAVERNLIKMQMAQKDIVGHGIRKSRAVVRDMATIIPADKDGEA